MSVVDIAGIIALSFVFFLLPDVILWLCTHPWKEIKDDEKWYFEEEERAKHTATLLDTAFGLLGEPVEVTLTFKGNTLRGVLIGVDEPEKRIFLNSTCDISLYAVEKIERLQCDKWG